MSEVFENINNFKLFFNKNFNPLCNYLHLYVRDREQCKEIAQDTFVKIWESRNKIDIKTSLKSYLYQAGRNKAIDYIRKSKKETEIKAELAISPEAYQEARNEADPSAIRELILEAMESLKPKCKEIFWLHKFEGLTQQEIADHLGISKRGVEDNIARALVTLKDELKDKIEY